MGTIIDPFLQRPAEGEATLETVLRKTKEIKARLEETDLFSQVQVIIDRSRDALAHPDDVDVVFLTKEKGRYFLNTSTQVGNNEGGAVSTLNLALRCWQRSTFDFASGLHCHTSPRTFFACTSL